MMLFSRWKFDSVVSIDVASVLMFRQIMDYLRYVQTWLWVWGIVSTSSVAVVIWAFITRLPGVVVFVLALGTGVLMLIALETVLVLIRLNQRLESRLESLEE